MFNCYLGLSECEIVVCLGIFKSLVGKYVLCVVLLI